MKKAYEEGERGPVNGRYNPCQVRVWVRRLHYQAFVPIDDFPSAFTSLCDEIPSERCLYDFLAYFSSTWVQGFAAGRSVHGTLPSCVLDRTSCHLNRSKN